MTRLKCVSKLLRNELQNEASWPRYVCWNDLAAVDLKSVVYLPVAGKLLRWSAYDATDPEIKLTACVQNLHS